MALLFTRSKQCLHQKKEEEYVFFSEIVDPKSLIWKIGRIYSLTGPYYAKHYQAWLALLTNVLNVRS